MVEYRKAEFTLQHRAVPYEDQDLFQAFEERQVPEREFLYRAFFGNRLPL